jgi:hypothetical protein
MWLWAQGTEEVGAVAEKEAAVKSPGDEEAPDGKDALEAGSAEEEKGDKKKKEGGKLHSMPAGAESGGKCTRNCW